MRGKFLIVGVLIVSIFVLANAQAKKKSIILDTKAILNGKAKILPKPVYSELAEALCVSGKVEVEILIDMNGDVIKAKAISGDELLFEASVRAAKKAKFPPSFITTNQPYIYQGIIVYNFGNFVKKKCLEGGVLNNKATDLPKPSLSVIVHPKHLRIPNGDEIKVRVLVDLLEGKVISALAVTGHPFLRQAFENAARKATFSPFLHGQGIFAKGVILYKVKPDGTVSTDVKEQKND
jgi:hypothetical protein